MKPQISTANGSSRSTNNFSKPRRLWWRTGGSERIVKRIFQDSPKGRRVVGYDVSLVRRGRTVYRIAAVYKIDEGFCWRLVRGMAQAIAERPAKYLDMLAGDRHVIDLRDRQQPIVGRMAA